MMVIKISYEDCGKDCPVDSASWDDTQEFIKKLNEMEGADMYRLPSEAEWEYAARAGTTTAFSFGDDAGRLGEYAWYSKNSGRKTHPVGKLKPNAWELYDMHGNVWEWCEDYWDAIYKGAPVDGSAWVDQDEGSYRVLRGGSWNDGAGICRTACRGRFIPDDRDDYVGFRLVRLPGQRGEPSR
jgi:formylglycine-generating enzyme required for sulfatase activity